MNHTDKISDKLTYEQFKALAERQPSLDGGWIYQLTHYTRGNDACYPAFSISKFEYLFFSFADAEKHIQQLLDHEAELESESEDGLPFTTYCFRIDQLPTAKLTYRTGAGWLYDKAGSLIDYSITDGSADPYQSSFFGRPESRMRFKKGDIVEVFDDDSVSLAIVGADGPSVDWHWKRYDRSRGKKLSFMADASDDCYYLLDGPGYYHHSHVHALNMMAPHLPIDDDIREFFNHCLEHADDESYKQRYDATTFHLDNLDRYSETGLRIFYDSTLQRHRLKQWEFNFREYKSAPLETGQVERFSRWLNEVRGGKTRLWFLIRDWNDHHRDEECEPCLSPDTPLSELL